MPPTEPENDDVRVGSALIVAVIGLLIPAALVIFLVLRGWKSDEISGIIGLFTGIVGTLVGAFLGVQVGAAGKEKAEKLANRALSALPEEKAKEVLRG
jgi:hypothetical protein